MVYLSGYEFKLQKLMWNYVSKYFFIGDYAEEGFDLKKYAKQLK